MQREQAGMQEQPDVHAKGRAGVKDQPAMMGSCMRETNGARAVKVSAAPVASRDELTGQHRPQPHGKGDQVQ